MWFIQHFVVCLYGVCIYQAHSYTLMDAFRSKLGFSILLKGTKTNLLEKPGIFIKLLVDDLFYFQVSGKNDFAKRDVTVKLVPDLLIIKCHSQVINVQQTEILKLSHI